MTKEENEKYWGSRRRITFDEIKIGVKVDIWSSHIEPKYDVIIEDFKDVELYRFLLSSSEGNIYVKKIAG